MVVCCFHHDTLRKINEAKPRSSFAGLNALPSSLSTSFPSSSCSEQSVIVVDPAFDAVMAEFRRQGATVLPPDAVSAAREGMVGGDGRHSMRMRPELKGQGAERVAELLGVEVPRGTRVLLGEVTEVRGFSVCSSLFFQLLRASSYSADIISGGDLHRWWRGGDSLKHNRREPDLNSLPSSFFLRCFRASPGGAERALERREALSPPRAVPRALLRRRRGPRGAPRGTRRAGAHRGEGPCCASVA